MAAIPVIAVFDIGKTNKKILLFDYSYKLLYEQSVELKETADEDGFPCEDINVLRQWITETLDELLSNKKYDVKALNFSAYGATFVFIGKDGQPLGQINNYLKPFPPELLDRFYDEYGGKDQVSLDTCSPVLGSLNSGMQVYRLKKESAEKFDRLSWAVHLPQYLSSIFTNQYYSDITSIGCHTNLWDFARSQYHAWVHREGVIDKLCAIVLVKSTTKINYKGKDLVVGIGLHDSSAALIPYKMSFPDPFILISTGTWSITLNPFNHDVLTNDELKADCLCYLDFEGKPVKASRLFIGPAYQEQLQKMAEHFGKNIQSIRTIPFDNRYINELETEVEKANKSTLTVLKPVEFDLNSFHTIEEACHGLMLEIVKHQYFSTKLVMKAGDRSSILVDGGFSRNSIFMNLLAAFFPQNRVAAATVSQATALGAALVIHKSWNQDTIPSNLVDLKEYQSPLANTFR